jgi:hypothetical protein
MISIIITGFSNSAVTFASAIFTQKSQLKHEQAARRERRNFVRCWMDRLNELKGDDADNDVELQRPTAGEGSGSGDEADHSGGGGGGDESAQVRRSAVDLVCELIRTCCSI